ncbi:hypothetical protein R6Q57_026993 [Mikania cordata]
MDAGEPINTGAFVLGLYVFFLIIIFFLCLISYLCNRNMSPMRPTVAGGDYHFIRIPEGIRDDVLETLPTFLYSQTVKPETLTTDHRTDGYGSGCCICLVDYKATDMLRLLPECGHSFHWNLGNCISTLEIDILKA